MASFDKVLWEAEKLRLEGTGGKKKSDGVSGQLCGKYFL